MNNQSGLSEQAPKQDTSLAIWAWSLWPWPLLVPVSLGLSPLDIPIPGASNIFMDILVKWACALAVGIPIFFAYKTLRRVLVSKGAAKGDLDAVTIGVISSTGFTALIAFPTGFALLGATLIAVKLLGFWDTFNQEMPVTTELAFSVFWVAVPTYIGWRLKGKSVYEKCIRQLGTASS